MRIRPKYSATVASRDRRIKIEQINKQTNTNLQNKQQQRKSNYKLKEIELLVLRANQ